MLSPNAARQESIDADRENYLFYWANDQRNTATISAFAAISLTAQETTVLQTVFESACDGNIRANIRSRKAESEP
jgi:hypothetical protein